MSTLSRGLEVLEFITRKRGASIRDIRLGTGLSKSVVHRIVIELANGGYVWRGVAEGKYYSSGLFAVSVKGARAHALKCAAHDPLRKLVEDIGWPSGLFVREAADMVLIDNTESISPFNLSVCRTGLRLPILLSAVGRAALAEMSDEARTRLYKELARNGEWNRQLQLCEKPIGEIIAEARNQRSAMPASIIVKGPAERQRLVAMAAAIVLRSDVVGAISIWWPEAAKGMGAQQGRLIAALKSATSTVAAKLEVILSMESA